MNKGRAATLLLIVIAIASLFFTWITIPEKGVILSGFSSTGIHNFGKPGILQAVFISLFASFFIWNKIWSTRVAFFISVFAIAWAMRNFIVLPMCSGGICPQRHTALYVLLIASLLMPLTALWSGKHKLPVVKDVSTNAKP